MPSLATVWGSTTAERSAEFPCDAYHPSADQFLYRAVTVRAPPETVFRWLCQLKVAPYSYDWIDNWGRTSSRTLTAGAEVLERGQVFMRIFELVDFTDNRQLTMLLRRGATLFGRIALSYVVDRQPNGETRLIAKLRVEHGAGFVARMRAPFLAWGDWLMMRKQLLTLKRLAEHSATT